MLKFRLDRRDNIKRNLILCILFIVIIIAVGCGSNDANEEDSNDLLENRGNQDELSEFEQEVAEVISENIEMEDQKGNERIKEI